MKASAIANSNIALVKYWGKRDEELILPCNSSISVTLEGMFAHTTVEFDENRTSNLVVINGKEIKEETREYEGYIGRFLSLIKNRFSIKSNVKVVSTLNFPESSGLASSAAGYAALATAIDKSLNLSLSKKELSILARLGSGSASRSIYGGFAEWKKGEKDDGSDSFAVQLYDKDYWPGFRMVVCITSGAEKKIKSRAGMKNTIDTSPLYKRWLETVEDDINSMKKALKEKNISLLGKTAELNCLKMHSTMITSRPPVIYWNEDTIKLMQSIIDWRSSGLECYFTMDAGPQVKIICVEKDANEITRRCRGLGIKDIIVAKSGDSSFVTEKHLF